MENTSYTIERRIYVNHKMHGTCVTYEARVYVAPGGIEYPKNVVVKERFLVTKEGLIDPQGRTWACKGENPGCGPRLPKELRDQHKTEFQAMTHAERKEFLKLHTSSK